MAMTEAWQAHIARWQGSGLTQVEYCRQQNINIKTFAARLSEHRHQQKSDQAVLMPIVVDGASNPVPLMLLSAIVRVLRRDPGSSARWIACISWIESRMALVWRARLTLPWNPR